MLEQLTYPQIDQLDRDYSIFILTFGILEQHGPHIPIGSDTYQAEAVRDGLVQKLQKSHPDYDVVLVPVIPLGEGGANNLAHEFTHIGHTQSDTAHSEMWLSIWVRRSPPTDSSTFF